MVNETTCEDLGARRPFEESGRQRRDRENRECVGGLRNPNAAVARSPALQKFGGQLRAVLDDFLKAHPAASHDILSCVGDTERTPAPKYLNNLRRRLTKHLQLVPFKMEEVLWSGFLEKAVELADDPDKEAASWPRIGTPLGIEEPLTDGGVFPRLGKDELVEDSLRLSRLSMLEGADNNYQSVDEHKVQAAEVFQKEIDKNFVLIEGSKARLEDKVGKLVPSSIGIVAKASPEGGFKLRFIHDLKRSGINALIRYTERLVLPRLVDAERSILNLFDGMPDNEELELLVLDYTDAFKHLMVRNSEKRYLSGEFQGRWFAYERVLFGITTGPWSGGEWAP